MKVLIITYYWVPSGGSGVQRWLKFVKYLPSFGVTPIVFTVKNPRYPIIDTSLEKDVPKDLRVIRQTIAEPLKWIPFLKKKTHSSSGFLDTNPSFFKKILRYIRANYFIPDARKFWIKPSVKKLHRYLKENPVDIIITTGPPHSVHLIGLKLKQLTGCKWLADFRDPWTNIDYFHQLPLTKKAFKKHQKLEQLVLKNASKVLVIGDTMKQEFCKITPHVQTITNGYDDENSHNIDFNNKVLTIAHIGLMNADRNPQVLWKVLSELKKENFEIFKSIQIHLVGHVATEVKESIQHLGLNDIVHFIGYVSHKKAVAYQLNAHVLFISVNRVPSAKLIITGKIFEYLNAKRNILAIGPTDGDLAAILKKTNAGTIVDFDDDVLLKETLIQWFRKHQEGTLKTNTKHVEQFHRKQLTEQLVTVLKSL